MTTIDRPAPTRDGTATDTVVAFFDAYRDHDTRRMVALCEESADLSYVPFEIWGKQRVLRGDGKVSVLGRPLWEGLIAAFPDLTNEVHAVTASDDGQVAAVVSIGGTQARDWGPIAARGGRYWAPHVFLFDVSPQGLIRAISAYWDSGTISQQLGHLEVD